MAIKQREVYLLPHPISLKSIEKHPFIVLSTEQANSHERTFIAVMITGSEFTRDEFSFDLEDNMFEFKLRKKECHARMHLVTLCLNEEIIGSKVNTMKEFFFKELMKSIGDLIFNYDFNPSS